MNYVVIFAGGRGARMGSEIPKQFLTVDGKEIIIHTIEKFDSHESIDGIVVVCLGEYIEKCRELVAENGLRKVLAVISGGGTGQQSIYNGLKYYHDICHISEDDIVLIHDGVRPVIDRELIQRSIDCARKNGNSISVSKAIETIIRVNEDGIMEESIDRSMCRYAKAPQCFRFGDIWDAHARALEAGITDFTDSATLMSWCGHKLFTIECGPENIKITTPNDFYTFKALYESGKDKTRSKEIDN